MRGCRGWALRGRTGWGSSGPALNSSHPRPAPQVPYVPLELGLEQLFQELAGEVRMGGPGRGSPPLPLDTDPPPPPTILGVSFCFSFSVPLCLNLPTFCSQNAHSSSLPQGLCSVCAPLPGWPSLPSHPLPRLKPHLSNMPFSGSSPTLSPRGWSTAGLLWTPGAQCFSTAALSALGTGL